MVSNGTWPCRLAAQVIVGRADRELDFDAARDQVGQDELDDRVTPAAAVGRDPQARAGQPVGRMRAQRKCGR
jgi:hypothetical protein